MDRRNCGWAAILMALALVTGIAGCGSGDSGGNAPTKAAFVKQGNAICGRWQQERSTIFSKFNAEFEGQNVTKADKEEGVLELLRPYEKATDKLGQMNPPDGDEEKVDAIVAAMEEGAEEIRHRPLTALTSNTAFENANELSGAYGLKECSF